MNAAAVPPVAGRWAAARNFSWLMTDKLASVVLGLAVFGLIARHYGAAGSGQLAFGLALLQTALGLSMVCSAAAVLPRLTRQRSAVGGPLLHIFVVRMAGSVVAAALTAVYAWLTVEDPTRLAIALILLASVPLLEPFYTAVVYWQSRNDNRPPTLIRATGLVVRAAVVALAVAAGAPLEVAALAWLLEALVSATLQTASLRRIVSLPMLRQRLRAVRAQTYFRFGVRFLPGLALASLFTRIDRLVLGEQLQARDFGLYAGAMQLVDIWVQVAYLLGFAVGPAFLYHELTQAARRPASFLREAVLLAVIGGGGLAAALLGGRWGLRIVFGPEFAAAAPYLVAGMAFAVLMFVDQLVQLAVTAANRPATLAAKWGAACATAVALQFALLPELGAFAGPAGLAGGALAGWLATALSLGLQRQLNGRAERQISTPGSRT